MTGEEKRRSQRFDTMNLLHYKVLDVHDKQLADGMARTLNVSEGGILLETNAPFDPGQEIAISIGLEEEMVDVIGQVVHCNPSQTKGMYTAGIKFEDLDQDGSRVLSLYLELFEAASES